VGPYSTWESLASSVTQAMAAPEDVTEEAVTPEMTGGVVSLGELPPLMAPAVAVWRASMSAPTSWPSVPAFL